MGRPRKPEPRVHLHLKLDAEVRRRLDKFLKKEGMRYRGGIAEAVNAMIDIELERAGF